MVCEISKMCVPRLFAKYSHQQSGTGPHSALPLASSHCTFHYLDLMCGEWEKARRKLLDLYSLLVKFYNALEGKRKVTGIGTPRLTSTSAIMVVGEASGQRAQESEKQRSGGTSKHWHTQKDITVIGSLHLCAALL